MTEAKKSRAKAKTTKDKVEDAEAVDVVADAEIALNEPVGDAPAAKDDPVAERADAPTPDDAPKPDEVVEQPVEPIVNVAVDAAPRASFMPMLAGGVVAAVIGIGISGIVNPNGWPFGAPRDDARIEALTQKLAAQDVEINQMTKDLADAVASAKAEAAASAASAAAEAEQLAAAQAEQARAEVSDMLAGFETRLSGLEKRPVAESVSPEAMAAYERELQALQDTMAKQRAEVEEKSASAAMDAQEAIRRAAFSRIETALDLGNGFAPALADLAAGGVEIPAELSAVADAGVASMAALSEQFPDLARAALATARATDTGGESSGGFAGFLKSQLGARSLEPREGSDPDAVLSRAEAALREGRLTDTLAELDALPENARAELTDWMASATARQNALAAAQTLNQALNKN